MTNRLTAAVRWLAQQARIYLAPKRAAREVRRLLADERTGPPKRRTRQTGVLKAVLRVLADGPCPLAEVVAGASLVDYATGRHLYTRAQVLAALRYAVKRGYVRFTYCAGLGAGMGPGGRWALIVPEDHSLDALVRVWGHGPPDDAARITPPEAASQDDQA